MRRLLIAALLCSCSGGPVEHVDRYERPGAAAPKKPARASADDAVTIGEVRVQRDKIVYEVRNASPRPIACGVRASYRSRGGAGVAKGVVMVPGGGKTTDDLMTPADERPMGPIEVRAENCYFR